MPIDSSTGSYACIHIQYDLSHTYTNTYDGSCQGLRHRPWTREHFVVSKGHTVASYSLLAQEQTDIFVKAESVPLIISLSLTPSDISAGHEGGGGG